MPTDYTLDTSAADLRSALSAGLAVGLTQVLADSDGDTYLYPSASLRAGGVGRIGEESAAGWQYHLPDALGSVRQLTSAGGAVVNATSYRPFGEVLSSAGSGASAYGFTSEWAEGTGLIYLRARYYDPRPGRFISRDPFPGVLRLPFSQHPYVYVANNPITLADPSGHTTLRGVAEAIIGDAADLKAVRDYLRCRGFLKGFGLEGDSSELTYWEQVWLGVSLGLVVITANSAEIALVEIAASATELGPCGIVFDTVVIAPIGLLIVDFEISYALYVYKVTSAGTKEGIEFEWTIYPYLFSLLPESWQEAYFDIGE